MFRFFCLILCLFFNLTLSAYKYELSIGAIFRDEGPYLKEWIEFHRLVGVEHFYLCSHNSTDNYREVLQPYIENNIVELREIYTNPEYDVIPSYFNTIQVNYYTDCINASRGVTKWIAFLDSDEFLFPTHENSLKDVLNQYSNLAIGVNWQMFGTSWVEKIPENKLLVETLTLCAPKDYGPNIHIKSIVRPEVVTHFENPHYAIFYKGFTQVNTDKIPFTGPFSPYVQVDKLRINHYWLRDESYFRNFKIPRRIKWGNSVEDLYQSRQELNTEVNSSILRFVPQLRKNLNL